MKKLKGKKVLRKILQNGRWYMILEDQKRKKIIMPEAQYNWLLANPSFQEIPKGYIIHHLDHDGLNNDAINLVLMQKYYHIGYHCKSKKIDSEVELTDYDFVEIMPKIKYYRRKDTKSGQERWVVYWDIKGKRFYLCSDNGQAISSEQQAQKIQEDMIEKYRFAIQNQGIQIVKNRG